MTNTQQTEAIRRLKGSAALLEFAALRLRILGEVHNANVIQAEYIRISEWIEANVFVIQPEELNGD